MLLCSLSDRLSDRFGIHPSHPIPCAQDPFEKALFAEKPRIRQFIDGKSINVLEKGIICIPQTDGPCGRILGSTPIRIIKLLGTSFAPLLPLEAQTRAIGENPDDTPTGQVAFLRAERLVLVFRITEKRIADEGKEGGFTGFVGSFQDIDPFGEGT